PALRQGLRHAPSTPLGILLNQPTNLGELGAANPATLNRFAFLHAPSLPDGGVGVPYNLQPLYSPAFRLNFDLSSYSGPQLGFQTSWQRSRLANPFQSVT